MFGGHVKSKSPHLRKSGSRPVFGDLGAIGTEEALLHSPESNEMRGVRTPLASTIMMPSPTFLLRFKIGWYSVMRMSADLRDLFLYEAFLYYNPLLLMCATWMTIIVPTSMTAYLYLYSDGEVALAASQPV
ncbi:hypothetical protein KSS87_013551 [Heliosperma pusillum]|nr:hypothetical protein KSS87_013551 [Heliosperma pusillum]